MGIKSQENLNSLIVGELYDISAVLDTDEDFLAGAGGDSARARGF